jgi:hypothetical protein
VSRCTANPRPLPLEYSHATGGSRSARAHEFVETAPGFWAHFVLTVCIALVMLGLVGMVLWATGVLDGLGVRLRMPCQVGRLML